MDALDVLDYCGAEGCGDGVVTYWLEEECGCCGREWGHDRQAGRVCAYLPGNSHSRCRLEESLGRDEPLRR